MDYTHNQCVFVSHYNYNNIYISVRFASSQPAFPFMSPLISVPFIMFLVSVIIFMIFYTSILFVLFIFFSSLVVFFYMDNYRRACTLARSPSNQAIHTNVIETINAGSLQSGKRL